MICFSSLAGSIADTTIPSGFNSSLRNDLQAAANIEDRIDQTSLATFMNIIEECEGQLLISGMGIAYGSCIDRSHIMMSLCIKKHHSNHLDIISFMCRKIWSCCPAICWHS